MTLHDMRFQAISLDTEHVDHIVAELKGLRRLNAENAIRQAYWSHISSTTICDQRSAHLKTSYFDGFLVTHALTKTDFVIWELVEKTHDPSDDSDGFFMHKSDDQIRFYDLSSGTLGCISCNLNPAVNNFEANTFSGSIPTSVAAGALIHALRLRKSRRALFIRRMARALRSLTLNMHAAWSLLAIRLHSDRFTHSDRLTHFGGSGGGLDDVTLGLMGSAQNARVDACHQGEARWLLALRTLLPFWSYRIDTGTSAADEQTLFNRDGYGWTYHVVPASSGRLTVHISYDAADKCAGGLEFRWKGRSTLSSGTDRSRSPSIEFIWTRSASEVPYSRCRVMLRPVSLERNISGSTHTATRSDQYARFIEEFGLAKEISYERNIQTTPASYTSRSECDVQDSNHELNIQLPIEFLACPKRRVNDEVTHNRNKQIN